MGEANTGPSTARPKGRRRSRGREFTLYKWHEEQLRSRMSEQGIKPSEALRQIIHENYIRGSALLRSNLRQQVSLIKAHCQLARARPSMAIPSLANIELAAEEILKLATNA